MKVLFLSFSDKRFKSWKRIKKEAITSGWFDRIIVGDESILEQWYQDKYKSRFADRGFGYWQWKSYLIRRTLDQMDEGDILIYTDAGCTINRRGGKRFHEYLDILNDESQCPIGIILFAQGTIEREWTKGDVFSYFGVDKDPNYTEHRQIASGILLIRKCKLSTSIIDDWHYICHNRYDLINDNPSTVKNFPEFFEGRHDQSILSLLAVKYGITELSGSEIWCQGNKWDEMSDFPIWASRRKDEAITPIVLTKRVYRKIKHLLFS